MLATVDLPEPDSPTIASVVPFLTVKAHIVNGLEHLLLARQLELACQMIHRDDGFAGLQGIFIHLVFHHAAGIATMLP